MIGLNQIKQVHLVGIGGVGLSALARLFHQQGKQVTGSDASLVSPIVIELKRLGLKIYHGHRARQVPARVEFLIYSLAIPENNPERRAATRRGLPQLSYPEALGLVTAGRCLVAVAGTHGKTTTTAMLGEILSAAGLDPTVIVGSLLKPAKTNLIVGRSDIFVVEACEYRRSFLNLAPQILIITNIDNDHLDYYRDFSEIQSAFAELAAKVPVGGAVICAARDPALALVVRASQAKIIDYLSPRDGEDVSRWQLKIPGEHNVLNAQAALAAALALKVSRTIALRALNQFNGVWRRFDYLGRTRTGALIYDDYAHHPSAVRATLLAARERWPRRRLVAVFQPHLYSRTKLLFNELVDSFAIADEVVLLPIYAARERIDRTVSSRVLATAIRATKPATKYFPTFTTAKKYLADTLCRRDILLTMGAGDIFVLAEQLRYNPRHD